MEVVPGATGWERTAILLTGEGEMKKVGAFEAKTHLSEYLRRVEEEGETILIQRYGKDVAVLRPWWGVGREEGERRASEILGECESIREEEAAYGANAEVKEMVEAGRKH
jgi:prevent-host-death family protein